MKNLEILLDGSCQIISGAEVNIENYQSDNEFLNISSGVYIRDATINTPLSCHFYYRNYSDETLDLEAVTVAIYSANDPFGEQVAEFRIWNPPTLSPGETQHYEDTVLSDSRSAVVIPVGNYIVRAKYKLDGYWYDFAPHLDDEGELTANMVEFTVHPYNTSLFPDLDEQDEMRQFIEELYITPSQNFYWGGWIINGYDNGEFRPAASITRGEVCTMICRSKGLTWNNDFDDGSFHDLDTSNSHYKAIYSCKHYGYIDGYGNGNFGPNDPVTRAQICKILCRAYDITPNYYSGVLFTDWFETDFGLRAYVAAVHEHCIANGYPDGRFGMNDNLQRRHACKMFINAMKGTSSWFSCSN